MTFGGLPEVALAPTAETKTEILNDVLSSYINIDIRVLADFQKIAELQQLLRVLASRIGNKLDHTKLASIVGISRPTLVQYLEFLEMTYVIRRLPAYSDSADHVAALGRKLYFYNNGIAGVLARLSEGALFGMRSSTSSAPTASSPTWPGAMSTRLTSSSAVRLCLGPRLWRSRHTPCRPICKSCAGSRQPRAAAGAPGGPLPDTGVHGFHLGRADLLAHTASLPSCALVSRLIRVQRGGCRPRAAPQLRG